MVKSEIISEEQQRFLDRNIRMYKTGLTLIEKFKFDDNSIDHLVDMESIEN
jgi:hypothetical protein